MYFPAYSFELSLHLKWHVCVAGVGGWGGVGMPTEARREHQILWNCSYRWLSLHAEKWTQSL